MKRRNLTIELLESLKVAIAAIAEDVSTKAPERMEHRSKPARPFAHLAEAGRDIAVLSEAGAIIHRRNIRL